MEAAAKESLKFRERGRSRRMIAGKDRERRGSGDTDVKGDSCGQRTANPLGAHSFIHSLYLPDAYKH
jgi:hypothetical protein